MPGAPVRRPALPGPDRCARRPAAYAATAGGAARTAPSPQAPGGPPPGTAWQGQLQGRVDVGVKAEAYDIDGFENDAETVAALQARSRKVIRYLDAGTWEDFRPDRNTCPPSVLGRGSGRPGERWVDVRLLDVPRPILAARMDMCRTKGFDAVEPDPLDGCRNDTGFPAPPPTSWRSTTRSPGSPTIGGRWWGWGTTWSRSRSRWTTSTSRSTRSAPSSAECAEPAPFIECGKAVFHAEYTLATGEFCDTARELGLGSIRRRLALDAWRRTR